MKFWDKVAEDQALAELRKARSEEPVKPADQIDWSNWRASPMPTAVETAYDRPHKEKRTYEVTINGLGKRPMSDCFEATSPGLARVAALDKYGRWISISEIKEMKPTPKRNRSSARGSRRSIDRSHQANLGKPSGPRHRKREQPNNIDASRRGADEVPAA